MTKRWFRSTVAVIAVLGLTSMASAAPAGNSLLVGVWDADGAAILGADVNASVDGVMAKGIEQGAGYYMFPAAGTVTADGLKVNIEVHHPVWGDVYQDILLENLALLSLDVAFDGPNNAQFLSPQMIDFQPAAPGGDGVGNDDCAGAVSVGANSSTFGSTIGATVDATEACGTSISAPGVWYSVAGTGTEMTATTCNNGTDYDSKITVYCGDCGDLTCLDGNDDNCAAPSFLLSTVTWCSQDGATYYILVHGFGTAAGNFQLDVSTGGSCTGAFECIPPEPTGACCFDDGSCDQLTASECAAAGGSYQGDDTPCNLPGSDNATGTGNSGAAIPDNDPASPVSNTINIAESFTVEDVNVTLNVTHTWQGDLAFTVSHGGTSVVIYDRPGVPASTFGCSADNLIDVVLDDEAGSPVEDACPVDTGSYIPNEALSAFDGMDSSGDWTISVTDNAGGDTGTFDSWTIDIAGAGEPACPQPECYLVIGDGQGATPWVGSNHLFNTQVGPQVEDFYPVLMEDIPSFLLPPLKSRATASGGQGFGFGAQMPDSSGQVPEWMADGSFAVQVIMWNPDVFPQLPEQFSVGLEVQILSNGRVIATPFGDSQGQFSIDAEITEVNGNRYISFPFVVEGF